MFGGGRDGKRIPRAGTYLSVGQGSWENKLVWGRQCGVNTANSEGGSVPKMRKLCDRATHECVFKT